MVNYIVYGATVLAAVSALAAFLFLSMERYVVSGTFFVLTAFSIYLSEMNR